MASRRCRRVLSREERENLERLDWLDWLLSDAEAGRYFSGQRLVRFAEERRRLRRALGRGA